jgi:hypothetical protein
MGLEHADGKVIAATAPSAVTRGPNGSCAPRRELVEPLALPEAQLIEPLQVLAVHLIDARHVPFVQLVEPLHDRVDRAEPSSHLPTAV